MMLIQLFQRIVAHIAFQSLDGSERRQQTESLKTDFRCHTTISANHNGSKTTGMVGPGGGGGRGPPPMQPQETLLNMAAAPPYLECKKNLNKMGGVSPSDIDKYSRVLFPVSFTCFNLMYWIIYLHISEEIVPDLVLLGSS